MTPWRRQVARETSTRQEKPLRPPSAQTARPTPVRRAAPVILLRVNRRASWITAGTLSGLVMLSTPTGCASQKHQPREDSAGVRKSLPRGSGFEQVGTASWYGPGFQGRRTASGERFNTNDLTAAHPTLPLGTQVVVTNLETGKSVRVRVNDRGPYVRGRKIDLSRAAARKIGMTRKGMAKVRIVVARPRRRPTSAASVR
jgi:rare lipoprotein A (peptidoglycan hydrolase)